jgi:hypothetical protein
MKRILVLTAVCVTILGLGSLPGKDKKPKPGPLTGTWECMSHGGSQGDMPFTLYLEQAKNIVSGSVSAPMGSTEITTGSFKKKRLELRLETSAGTYLINGKLKKGQLSGEWSHDASEKGTWEGKKQASTGSQ